MSNFAMWICFGFGAFNGIVLMAIVWAAWHDKELAERRASAKDSTSD